MSTTLRDRRIRIFFVLNLVQAALVGAIPILVASRATWVNWVLGGAAAVMVAAAFGLILFGRWGRLAAALACLVHGLIGTSLAALVATSATYLYGIYGSFGHSVGAIAFALAAVVLIVFWLIPAHELHYLGKRGFGP